MTEQGEILLAVVGLKRVLAGDPPTPADVRRSLDLEQEIRGLVGAYLAGKRNSPRPVPDIELPKELPDAGDTALGDLDQEIALDYAAAAARALAYLGEVIPERWLAGLTARRAARTHEERATYKRVLQAVDDPVGVLGDLASTTPDQLSAIKAVYPSMWATVSAAATAAGGDADRELTAREERVIARLQGVSVTDVKAMQAVYAAEKQAAAAAAEQQGGGGDPMGPPMATPAQKLATT